MNSIESLLKESTAAKFGLREQTILNTTVRDASEISADKISVQINPQKLKQMLAQMRDCLGLSENGVLTPYLHNLLIYGPGQFFKPHRESEVCNLQWDWEIKLPQMPHLMVFIIPAELVKNGEERLVVCNQTAKSVVDSQRGKHKQFVFAFKGKPVTRMNNTGWKEARKKAGLEFVRVHDLKHTFGRRLRSVGVSFEDRQDLLGHRSGRITTHYSSAELQNLYEAGNKVCEKQQSGVVLTLLRNPNNRKEKDTSQNRKVISL